MSDEVILKCPHCKGEVDHDNSLEHGTMLKRIAGADDILVTFSELRVIWYCPNCDGLFEMLYKFDRIIPLKRSEDEKKH